MNLKPLLARSFAVLSLTHLAFAGDAAPLVPAPAPGVIASNGNATVALGYPWNPGDPYTSPDALTVTGGQMTIRGLPYGYYDTGTLLSLNATNRDIYSSRAGINGGYEQGVPAMAGDPDFDLVSLYNQVGNTPPRLVLHDVKYDATHIYPATPLTSAQMALLRPSMWVFTNAVDRAITPGPNRPDLLPRVNRYGSTIKSWAADGSAITVSGWTVPGGGNARAGQVPAGTLDTTSYSVPTAFIGGATKAFTNNWVLSYDPKAADARDSQIKQFEGLELDLWNFGTRDYQASFHGITIGYDPFGVAPDGHHVAPTADSYDLLLAGPMPTMLKIDAGGGSRLIDANSFLLRSPDSPAPAVGSTNVVQELQNAIDSNRLRLLTWTSRDRAGGGWPAASLHVGLHVDGTKGQLDGSPMGEVVYNPPGYGGGLGLKGAGQYGLYVDDSGKVTAPQGVVSNGPVQLPRYTFPALPAAGTAGREVFCSDACKPGEAAGAGTGMTLFDDGHGRWFSTAGTVATH